MATKAKFESTGFEVELSDKGEWLVVDGKVKVSNAQISNGNLLKTHTLTFHMDFKGMNINEIAEDACRSRWIKLQEVRKQNDAAVEKLYNGTIHVNDIASYTENGSLPDPKKVAGKMDKSQLEDFIAQLQKQLDEKRAADAAAAEKSE